LQSNRNKHSYGLISQEIPSILESSSWFQSLILTPALIMGILSLLLPNRHLSKLSIYGLNKFPMHSLQKLVKLYSIWYSTY